jgi:hypothetical protein
MDKTTENKPRRQDGRPRRNNSSLGQRQRPRKSYSQPGVTSNLRVNKKHHDIIPSSGDNIRIIPLGGVEEIGKNMTVIEYRNDIIVVDMGFQFKDDDTPGVDYILPNTKYLEDRKDKIRGVFITHGHLDHIGGIPYIMDRIGNPPLYTRSLTSIMIRKRQEEFPHLPELNIKVIEKEDAIRVGDLKVRFFAVTHSIPDSMGLIIDTPYGSIVAPGDIKLDHNDGIPTEAEEKEFGRFRKEKVILLMMDSTNVENPGFSTPEIVVFENLDKKRDKYVFLKMGGILYILIWIARIYFTSSISAYILSTLAGLATAMIAIPFIGITYSKAEEEDIEDFLFFKEIPVFIGRIILLITIIILADKFIIAFVFSALATLGFVLMKLKK